jgi:hypothetical protein
MACIVCTRDVSDSTQHRDCVMTLFKEKRIKSVADWIRLSTKPKTVIKGRVLRVVEPATNSETPPTAS